MQTREIYVLNTRAFEQEIARLNKKATRIGAGLVIAENQGKVSRTRTTLVTGGDGEGEVTEKRIPLDVTKYLLHIPSVELRGWEALARITPVEGNGAFVEPLKSGFDVAPWKDADVNRCDHCNTNRRRVVSYVVSNVNDDRVMQVGRKCFEDIVGKDTLAALEFEAVVICNLGGDDEGFYPMERCAGAVQIVATRLCIAYAEALRKQEGWVNNVRNQDDGYGERRPAFKVEGTHRVAAHYAAFRPLHGEVPHSHEARKSMKDAPAWEEADAIIARIREMEVSADDEFATSLKNVADYDSIPAQKAGIAAYMGQFLRNLDERTRQEAKKATLQFVGKIGERLTFVNLTCVRCPSFTNDFGTVYVNTFEDADGNVLVWKTGSNSYNEGQQVTLKGTVKDHTEYKGTKQTILSRCKEQN